MVVIGTRPSRLELARRFGADAVVDSRQTADVRGAVRDALNGGDPDVVIEIAGVPEAQQDAVRLVRRGGRVVLAGACGAGAMVMVRADEDLLTREVDLLPSFLSAGGFEPAISLLSRDGFPFEELVTHRFALDEVRCAFAVVESRADGVIKAVLDPRSTPTKGTTDDRHA